MAEKQFPLSVVIRAVDRVTAPLRAINDRIRAATAPARGLFNSFRALGQEAGIGRVAGAFGNVGRAIGRVTRETWELGKRFALLATVAGFAFVHFVRSAVNGGDAMAELNARVGLGIQNLYRWQFIAQEAGVSNEEFAASMDQMSKRMGELRAGTGSLKSFLDIVSPKLGAQLKGTRSNAEAFELLVRAMQRIEDPGKRAAFAAQAFGRSGLKMAAISEYSAEKLRELIAEYDRLAGNREEFAARASKFDDAWNRMIIAFEGVRDAAIGELLPALTELMGVVKELFVENRDAIAGWAREFAAELPARVAALTKAVRDLYAALAPIISGSAAIIEALGGIKFVAWALAAVIGTKLILAVYGLAKALAFLGVTLMATPFGWVLAGAAALAAAALLIYSNWDRVVGVFKSFLDVINRIIDPFGFVQKIGGQLIGGARSLFGGNGPELGAAGAAQGMAGGRTEAHVTVDFNNVPRGVRVNQDQRGAAPIDLSVGYTMADSLGVMP